MIATNAVTVPMQERIESSDGVKIFVRSWRPIGVQRGVMILCHGLNAHGGQYEWTANQLQSRGLAVYALDLRGRGQSEGTRFTVNDFGDYVSDLAAVVNLARQREGGMPILVLGHSAGGVVAVTYALDNQDQLSGLICESFAYRVPAPAFAIWTIRLISRIVPRLPILKLKNSDFSRDRTFLQKLDADPYTQGEVQPAITVASLARANQRLRSDFSQIKLPILILHGTADKATQPAGSQEFYDRAGSTDKEILIYDGYYHDLLSDLGKEKVIADIEAWIDRHLPR